MEGLQSSRVARIPEDIGKSLLGALLERLQVHPKEVLLLQSIGKLLAERGDVKQALKYFLQATQADEMCVEAWHNCGLIFMELGKEERAQAFFSRALALDASYLRSRMEVGRIHFRRQEREEALHCFHNILSKQPMNGLAHNNVGAMHWRDGDVQRATACFERAVESSPNDVDLLANLGAAYMEDQRMLLADQIVLHALAEAPNNAEVHFLRSHGLLMAGRWLEGWSEYEWRFQLRRLSCETFRHLRHWKGEDIVGRTLLVVAEQGFGDSILTLRYLPLLHAAKARVKVLMQDRLVSLVKQAMPFIEVIEPDDEQPAADLYVHTMSLPHRFGTTINDVPGADGYLCVNERAPVVGAPGTHLKVGLSWACNVASGTANRRSVPLKLLQQHFAHLQGVTFYSLQHGPAADALMEDGNRSWIHDECSKDLDFLATARTMAALDLVISVDTALAHLSGALGKPTWILLPYAADWRWLTDTEMTPWYNSARLLRQPKSGDWNGLLASTALELLRTTCGGAVN